MSCFFRPFKATKFFIESGWRKANSAYASDGQDKSSLRAGTGKSLKQFCPNNFQSKFWMKNYNPVLHIFGVSEDARFSNILIKIFHGFGNHDLLKLIR